MNSSINYLNMTEFLTRILTFTPITKTIMISFLCIILLGYIIKLLQYLMHSRINIYGGDDVIKEFNSILNKHKHPNFITPNIKYITLNPYYNNSPKPLNYGQYNELLNNTIIEIGNPKNLNNIQNIHRRPLNMILDISGFDGKYASFKFKPYKVTSNIKRPDYTRDFIITVNDIFPFKQTKIYVFQYIK